MVGSCLVLRAGDETGESAYRVRMVRVEHVLHVCVVRGVRGVRRVRGARRARRQRQHGVGELAAERAEELAAVHVQVVRPLRRLQSPQVGAQTAQVQVVPARLHVHAALPPDAHAHQPRLLHDRPTHDTITIYIYALTCAIRFPQI